MTKALLTLLLTLSISGSSFAADAKPAWRVEWDKTVAAAEKEGTVSIYIFEAGPLTEETVLAFERAYPKIKVNQLRGRGNDLGPRIVAERRAGKYLVDLFAGGKGTALGTLYVGKLLDPIRPLLLLPDVLDETKWWRREHKYVDPENKYIFAYIGNAGGVEINYNSTSVNPKEFTSYWDLTQPRWKGKIAATDPRSRGMDNPVLFFYYHAKLGPEFIRKLYGDMEVAIARDYRQPVDWLASGRYSLCIPCVSDEMDKAMDQGLPVGQILRLKGRWHAEFFRWDADVAAKCAPSQCGESIRQLALVAGRTNRGAKRPQGAYAHRVQFTANRYCQERSAGRSSTPRGR